MSPTPCPTNVNECNKELFQRLYDQITQSPSPDPEQILRDSQTIPIEPGPVMHDLMVTPTPEPSLIDSVDSLSKTIFIVGSLLIVLLTAIFIYYAITSHKKTK